MWDDDEVEEEWDYIFGYDNYLVSNHGRIKNEATGRIRKLSNNAGGYPITTLSKPGTRSKTFLVHRLVAESFVEGYHEDLQVNHINGDKEDNYFENLEWVTAEYNMLHARMTGLNPGPPKGAHAMKKSQGYFRRQLRIVETGEKFPTRSAVAKHLGVTQPFISQVVKSRGRLTAKGYHIVLD